MAFKKLMRPTGCVNMAKLESDSEDQVSRSAILVHSAPNGKAMVFQSADGAIEFDDARIKRIIKNHNAKINDLAKGYGGVDKMPNGAFPPILDQHTDHSNNSIRGRLNNLLRFEKRDIPGVGPNCSCVVTDILFLGKDTVEQVKDGRIYHLSIGIDEESDTLGETSTVIEPAAPGAMLLSKSKNIIKGEIKMAKKSKLMVAQVKRMTKLAAINAELTKGIATLDSAKANLHLTKKKGEIQGKLHKLMASKKLMPSEFKKMDITKLAKLDDESLSTVLSTFEAREDQVLSKQRGSTDALAFADLGKSLEKRQMKRLSNETKKDLIRMGAKLKAGSEIEADEDEGSPMSKKLNEMPEHVGEDEHAVHGQEGESKMAAHLAKMEEHHEKMTEHLASGNIEGAREEHENMKACHMAMKSMQEAGETKHMSGDSDVKGEDYEKSMSGVQGQVDELNTQMARLAGMVKELMGSEEEEGHELEAASDEEIKDEIKK